MKKNQGNSYTKTSTKKGEAIQQSKYRDGPTNKTENQHTNQWLASLDQQLFTQSRCQICDGMKQALLDATSQKAPMRTSI